MTYTDARVKSKVKIVPTKKVCFDLSLRLQDDQMHSLSPLAEGRLRKGWRPLKACRDR